MDKNLINKLLGMAMDLFKSKALPAIEQAAAKEVAKPVQVVEIHTEAPVAVAPALDWNNPASKLSENFTVKDALLLPSWGAQHVPSDTEKEAIKGIAEKVTKALAIIAKETGKPAHASVHAWMRPEVANIPGSQWNGKDS
jgi:hypothetical protein